MTGSLQSTAGWGLSPESAAAVAEVAVSLWNSVPAGATLPKAAITVADLPGATLAMASGNSIVVDADAAGVGWFVDSTPSDHSEFAAAASRRSLVAQPASAAAGRYDLLTAIAHEYGHLLGYGHADEGDSLMSKSLSPGERRLPDDASLNALAADVLTIWES
jgi:hypothetical protein